MRTILVIMAAALVLAVTAAIAGALLARHFYFQAKLAAAAPVAVWMYAGENENQHKKDVNRVRQGPRIVLIGDSRVHAMHLKSADPKWEVLSRGINGETSAQLLLRFEADALSLKPDLIVIQSGINDLVAGMGSDGMAPEITARTIANLKKMAERAAAAGSKVVVLTVIPPARPDLLRRFVWNDGIRNEVASVNSALMAWNPPNGVRILDLSEVFGSTTVLPARFSLNTLHLNQTGYALLEEKLNSLISSLVD